MANFANAFFAGMDQGANRAAVQSQTALRGAQTQAVTRESELKQRKATLEEVGRAAAWADTPEKWTQAIDVLKNVVPEVEQYRNAFPQREMLIQGILTETQQYDQMLGGRMAGALGTSAQAPAAEHALAPQGTPAVTVEPLNPPVKAGDNSMRAVITSAADKHGENADTLYRFAQLESNLDPNAKNPGSSASGLFQFIGSTAKQYGITDPMDPNQSADGGARLLRDNRAALPRMLGREATEAELYLAQQQGAGGAAALLKNPDMPAIEALAPAYNGDRNRAREAILKNGGNENMTAGEFAAKWTGRFDKTGSGVQNINEVRFPREDSQQPASQPGRGSYGSGLTTSQRLALASGSGDKISEAFKGADLDFKSDAGKVINDRQMFTAQYGEGSPQVRAFDEMARSTGGPKLSDVAGVRKEFTTLSKDFVQVRDAFGRINAAASNPDAAGDLALIFNFMKMLDPGSVVRETEFATAQNAAGVPEIVRNIWNRAKSGERLNPEQRERFIDRAKLLYAAQLASHKRLTEQFRGLAERQGMDPDNVTVDFVTDNTDAEKPAEPSAARPPPTEASLSPQQRNEARTMRQKYGLDLEAGGEEPAPTPDPTVPGPTAPSVQGDVTNQPPPEAAAPQNPDAGPVQSPLSAEAAPTLPNSNLASRPPANAPSPALPAAPGFEAAGETVAAPGGAIAGDRDPNLAALLRRSGYDDALAEQARRGRDGKIYVPDPNRPGKWLGVETGAPQ